MGKTAKRLCKVIFGTAAAWTVAVKPRLLGKPDLSEIRRYDYARRGLYDPEEGIPENSLAAFRAAIDAGYGIALDVRLSSDGTPVVFHDSSLHRMLGLEGTIEESSWGGLSEQKLAGTDETIPTLEEALELIAGRVPVLIELRTCGDNVDVLCDRASLELDMYDGVFAVQSLDPRVLRWFKKERNEYIRGQVVDYSYRSGDSFFARVWDFLANSLLMNFFTGPDYVSTFIGDRNKPSLWLCRLVYRVQRMDWTVTSMEEYELVKTDGSIALFEGIEP